MTAGGAPDAANLWLLQAKLDELGAWATRVDVPDASSGWNAAVRYGYRCAQSDVQQILHDAARAPLADVAGAAYRPFQPDRR